MTQPSSGSSRAVNDEPGSVPAPGAMPFLVSLAVLQPQAGRHPGVPRPRSSRR